MSGSIDILNPDKPKKVAIVASNPAVSQQTGWPIGFWWSELTHPYWEFVEHGYSVEIFSPDGGELQGDAYSDPRDPSKYSAFDLLSLGFISSPDHRKLVENSKPIKDLNISDFDAILLVGGKARCTPSTTTSACTNCSLLFMKPAKSPQSSAMPLASCSKRNSAMANSWSTPKPGRVLRIPKNNSPIL